MYAIKKSGAQVVEEYTSDYHLRRAFPYTAFPSPITQESLNGFNVYLIKRTAAPSYDPATQRIEEGYDPDTYEQTWAVVDLTEEELDALVPRSVTMRQGRLALLQFGILDYVEAAIDGIEDPVMRRAAQIEWEYAQTIDRDSPFTQSLASQLALTPQQMRELFSLASTL